MDRRTIVDRIRSARSADDVRRVIGTARTNGEAEMFSVLAGENARHIDVALVIEIAEYENGARAIAKNPYIACDDLERCFGQAARELVGRFPKEKPFEQSEWTSRLIRALTHAARHGLIGHKGEAAQQLWSFVFDAAEWLWRRGMVPAEVLAILLEMRGLPRKKLHVLSKHMQSRDGKPAIAQNSVDRIVAHPNADETVWLAALALDPPELETVLAVGSRSLKCARVRARIFQIVTSPDFDAPMGTLTRVCKNASGSEFRDIWREILRRDAGIALYVLEKAGRARMAALEEQDFSRLLSHDEARIRERAIAALGNLKKPVRRGRGRA